MSHYLPERGRRDEAVTDVGEKGRATDTLRSVLQGVSNVKGWIFKTTHDLRFLFSFGRGRFPILNFLAIKPIKFSLCLLLPAQISCGRQVPRPMHVHPL